jgi:DNA-3-methyladenine glycosylase
VPDVTADPVVDPLAALLATCGRQVAPRLLGSVITRAGVSIRLTEVEAYDGADDPASHAWRGRTPRNAVMFGPAGRLYVYFTYGMHHAANLVCGPVGTASAVLLRAGEVVDGTALAHERRGTDDPSRLARGPGNLAQALGLTLADNGAVNGSGFDWEPAGRRPRPIGNGPRVGVSRAADRPWRWWVLGDRTVSAYRRSPRADPPLD